MSATTAYEYQHDDEPLPASGYRTYEVYQRERVGETTNLLKPRQLIGDDYLTDPYPLVGILRENYPCYRDWVGNRFWITHYDDVTSVFADEANYETRTKRWFYGRADYGRDLGDQLPVAWAFANGLDNGIHQCVDTIIKELRSSQSPDLAVDFAARLPLDLWGQVLDLDAQQLQQFAGLYWQMQRGWRWHAPDQRAGSNAIEQLEALISPILDNRRGGDGPDLITAAANLEGLEGGRVTAADLVATILEADHETMHGGLANLWFLLLTNPDQLQVLRGEPRLCKFAWLEMLRHSTPVLSAARFARHEVERFGRLLPGGALLYCSAGAANRDPRVFSDPDTFDIARKDLCQREPRGQYRADGLPSGVAFGMGKPSVHPAVPKERPRSLYAITRDTAVVASTALLEAFPSMSLAVGAQPSLRSLRIGEMHTCWSLPVQLT